MSPVKQRVLTITGPTASGKSGLAVELARRFPLDIISVDSAVVYRGMDIGTAKPPVEIREEIPHHLIDIRDPADSYSAAAFRSDAIATVSEVLARGRIPCLVGGTMLYLRSLKHGIARLPSADPAIRRRIVDRAVEVGWAVLHGELARADPAAASRISPGDAKRIQRALEVYEITGRSITELHQEGNLTCPFDLVEIAIVPDRALLHQRIDTRFRQMLADGLVHEVAGLLARPDLHVELPSMKSVGYRQIGGYLAGEFGHEQMIEKALVATRRLAKHQCTWLNKWQDLHVLADPDSDQALKISAVASILEGAGRPLTGS